MTTIYTNDDLRNMTPMEYAKERNAQINAQAEAEGWDFWSNMPEDEEYFTSHDWETAYDYVRETEFYVLCDVYKETYGFRPRGKYIFEKMSLEDIRSEIKRLQGQDDAVEEVTPQVDDGPLTHNPFTILGGA